MRNFKQRYIFTENSLKNQDMSRKEQLIALLESNPTEPFLLFALAKEFEKESQNDKALALYEQLVTDHSDYIGTYYHFGKLLEQLDHLEEARLIYHNGIHKALSFNDMHSASELRSALDQLESDSL